MLGRLEINAVAGKDLKNCETFKKQDPYLKFKLGDVTKRTRAVNRGGTHPNFNESLSFDIKSYQQTQLLIKCYDEDLGKDDLIGESVINLENIFKAGELDAWFPIFENQKKSGDIYLEFTFKRH